MKSFDFTFLFKASVSNFYWTEDTFQNSDNHYNDVMCVCVCGGGGGGGGIFADQMTMTLSETDKQQHLLGYWGIFRITMK